MNDKDKPPAPTNAATVRFAAIDELIRRGERAAASAELEPLALQDTWAADALERLARLSEDRGDGAGAARLRRRLLAFDIDHPSAPATSGRERLLGGEATSPPDFAASMSASGAAATLVAPAGARFVHFQILRELGRGATATVYLARDDRLDLNLALKVLHPSPAGSAQRQRFRAEAVTAAGLRHPGVIAVYDLDEATSTLAMEYLAGGTLREALRTRAGANGPAGLPLPYVVSIADSVLATLAYLHARGVVHGDLTPRNLLLRRPLEDGAPAAVVLADFGAARQLLSAATPTEALAGTPLYLAPEQLRGTPASPATDLFAVGAILWELAVGAPMRSHATLLAGGGATPLPEAARDAMGAEAPGLIRLIDELTARAPEERPPSAAAARARLAM